MSNKVNIAIDAMGGENSPKKIIDGIEISLKSDTDKFFLSIWSTTANRKRIGQEHICPKIL